MPEKSGRNEQAEEENGSHVAGWYDEYHQRLLKYLRGSLRTEFDAQDVSQEVFLRLLRVPEDRVIDHPRAYLFRVAANVLNDWWAGRKIFEAQAAQDPDQIPAADDCAEDYDQRKGRERLQHAIRSLPPHHRAALLLKTQHGMTYQEIAAHLHVSERMVKRYLIKAYAQLRGKLSAPGSDCS